MGTAAPEHQSTPGPTPLQQAGVRNTRLEYPDLVLDEVANLTLLRLHSLDRPAALAGALAEARIDLPLETNAATGRNPAVLCLRPGEWLLLDAGDDGAGLIARVASRLDPRRTALIDVSDGLGVFRLTGAAAPWLLGKLSGLDFLAGVGTGQHAARTRLGDIAVVLHYRPDADTSPRFDLLFDRSMAGYLWDLLNDAAPHAGELHTVHGTAHGTAHGAAA